MLLPPPPTKHSYSGSQKVVRTAISSAVLALSLSLSATAATTDYSNQTLDHGISVIGEGNSITGDNLTINGSSYVDASQRNEGIYIGAGSSGTFGGDKLIVKFTTDDGAHEFAGIQVNGQTTGNALGFFDADETIIDVSGPGNSGKWSFGLLVNGAGSDTAEAHFTGGSVAVKTSAEKYTSQSVTVKSNALLDFSNSGDVMIEAYSPFGVTVVDAYGTLQFNNDGNVSLIGEIIPGDTTGETNVVGIQGTDAHWSVTDRVKVFRIELSGAGVDNDGTSYSTGTKGIELAGWNGSFGVQSEQFVIQMDIAEDIVDDSPGDHTAEEAYGINIHSSASMTIGSNTQTKIVINEGLGTAYGINVDSAASLVLNGDTTIETHGKKASIALQATGTDSTVTIAGSNNHFVGEVIAQTNAAIALQSGRTVVDGKITADESSTFSLTEAELELAHGSTLSATGTLSSANSRILLNDATEGTVSIAKLANDASLEVAATGTLNDVLGGDIAAFQKAIWIADGAENTALVMEEGLVAGEVTGSLNADGTLDTGSVHTKVNSVMQANLEMASALPLAMTRILNSDLRKRMGNLRNSEGAQGAWARFDGGNLDGSLETDFQTIQAGYDVKPGGGNARVGMAFSYTNGDSDAARSSADLEGFSLAGYGTWFADNGLYADVVARFASIKNDIDVGSDNGDLKNLAMGLSAEAGMRFDLGHQIYLEPQIEAAYTHIDSDEFSISAADYDLDATNSLTGRIGFISGLTCPHDAGEVYLRASVVHEFLGDAAISGRTTGSTGKYETDGSDTWVEFGLGAQFNLSTTSYVWADIERTEGAAMDEDWRATVGVRYGW